MGPEHCSFKSEQKHSAPIWLKRDIGAGSRCAGYVDGANARLRPHPLDKWHFVDELMLQSAQNMQADEHDKRRGQ